MVLLHIYSAIAAERNRQPRTPPAATHIDCYYELMKATVQVGSGLYTGNKTHLKANLVKLITFCIRWLENIE